MALGYVITWDEDSSASLDGVIFQKVNRGGFGEVRNRKRNVAGQEGATLYVDARGNRRIVVSGVVVPGDATTRRENVIALADWADRDGYRRLVFDDAPDRYWSAAIDTEISPDEWRSIGRFELEWTALPYAFGIDVSEESASASSGASKNFSAPDAIWADPIVEITATDGTVVGFTLDFNGSLLTYAGTLTMGQTITINGLTQTVTLGVNTDTELTGVYVPGTVFPADVSGEWPVVQAGTNAWSVTWSSGTATRVDVTVSWRRRYRG